MAPLDGVGLAAGVQQQPDAEDRGDRHQQPHFQLEQLPAHITAFGDCEQAVGPQVADDQRHHQPKRYGREHHPLAGGEQRAPAFGIGIAAPCEHAEVQHDVIGGLEQPGGMAGDRRRGKHAVDQRKQEIGDKADQKADQRSMKPALRRGI